MKNYYFKIAFCDQPSLKTKFGSYYIKFNTPLQAEEAIESRNGWYYAIQERQNTPRAYKIDDGWLMIELCFEE